MGKSDEYIEYEAYTRYLKKVTSQPYGSEQIISKAQEVIYGKTELRAIYDISVRIAVIVVAVLALSAGVIAYSYFFTNENVAENPENVWMESRLEKASEKRFRLYEAYRNSNTIRDLLLWKK